MEIFSTLKGRFSLFAVVLVLVAIASAVYVQKNVQKTSDVIAIDLAQRHESQAYSREIRDGLFDSYRNLTAFLLDPSRTQLRVEIHSSIQHAINASKALSHANLINTQSPSADKLLEMTDLLKSLEAEYLNAENVRIQSVEQYPSLGLGNSMLRPNRIEFVNAMALALFELKQNEAELYSKEIYETFIETRHLWMQMVSNFRLYLANRLGSYNEDSLVKQEEGIEQVYQTLVKQLFRLSEFDEQGLLGFEASDALETMKTSGAKWFNGFLEIKKVHNSGEWRTDVNLLKQRIEPKLKAISQILGELNTHFEASNKGNITDLHIAANVQTQYMWFVLAAIIFFISISVFFFENLILRPVKIVSGAMKAVAFGESGVSLPAVKAKETQDLMDAFNEMRSQVRSRQYELEHQALHDSLTGLANRTLLRDRLAQAVYSAKLANSECSLLILDLDRFKEINESLSHYAGDTLLVEVGIRLVSVLREIDTVARLGGDEFAILLPQSSQPYSRRVVNKIEMVLESIREVNGSPVYVSGTIGIAHFPEHGENANVLLRRANAALNQAKITQKSFYFYNENECVTSPDRLTLIGDLRDAIANNLLYLEYQPQFDFKFGEIIGVEALIRWRHPRLGQISADQIISIAEQTGQIHAITQWVLNQAVKQCAQWRADGIGIGMSINLSVLNLQDESLVSQIDECITQYNVDCGCLTFEITESAMMINPVSALKTLKQLESKGIKLVIDDFGTGFSSLSYLKQLPVESLKLDKSFVVSLDKESENEVIVRSTIELAHNLGLQVVAEGVESKASWDILKQLNCDFAQGFYMSKPQSADNMKEWLLDQGEKLVQFS